MDWVIGILWCDILGPRRRKTEEWVYTLFWGLITFGIQEHTTWSKAVIQVCAKSAQLCKSAGLDLFDCLSGHVSFQFKHYFGHIVNRKLGSDVGQPYYNYVFNRFTFMIRSTGLQIAPGVGKPAVRTHRQSCCCLYPAYKDRRNQRRFPP